MKQAESAAANIASLIVEDNVDVIAMNGLMEKVGDPSDEEKILRRHQLAAQAKGVNKMLLIDGAATTRPGGACRPQAALYGLAAQEKGEVAALVPRRSGPYQLTSKTTRPSPEYKAGGFSMQFTAASVVAGARRREDGALLADVRIAHTAIQLYAGHEVGRSDMAVVGIDRPGTEVFSATTMGIAAHRSSRTIIPAELVTDENWKQHAVAPDHNTAAIAEPDYRERAPAWASRTGRRAR